jgi:hypothetical protein
LRHPPSVRVQHGTQRVGEPNGGANQIWQLVPSHIRGYYFIQSNLNGYVLDIEGAKADGRLIAHPRKSSGMKNQLCS